MAKTKRMQKIDSRVVEIGGRRIVLMDEEQYDLLLDAIDAIEAQRIAADPKDPVLRWDDIKRDLIQNRIAEVRGRLGLTQHELARRLKVRQSTLSRMERSNANLTLVTLRRLAKALGCSVHELI